MNRTQKTLDRWINKPGIDFLNPETEKNYRSRAKRIADSIQLIQPDRVPVCAAFGMFPALDNRLSCRDVMDNYDMAADAWIKAHLVFSPDAAVPPWVALPAKVIELLRYASLKLPGRDIPANVMYQFEDREHVSAAEFYDGYLKDPSDFMMRTFLPRVCESLSTFQSLNPFTSIIGYANGLFPGIMKFGDDRIFEAMRIIGEAGKEAVKYYTHIISVSRTLESMGYPTYQTSACSVPFDLVGDWFRGTRGVMTDMYRYPEKLKAVLQKMAPVEIETGIAAARESGSPIVSLMLHKGSAQFLSLDQFKEFYWPGLKEVMLGIIEAGFVPMPLFEGNYTNRLDIIKDIPKGKAVYWFENVDIIMAQKALGNHVCFRGNVPGSLIQLGTPDQVEGYVNQLIDVFGTDGGLIVDTGMMIDEAKHENVKAMIETAKRYGKSNQ